MGWTSAVTLIQAVSVHIAYSVAKVPSCGDCDTRKDSLVPAEDRRAILYLDNFGKIRYLKKEIATGHGLGWGFARTFPSAGEIISGLVLMDGVTEFCVRRRTGKVAYAAACRRPL